MKGLINPWFIGIGIVLVLYALGSGILIPGSIFDTCTQRTVTFDMLTTYTGIEVDIFTGQTAAYPSRKISRYANSASSVTLTMCEGERFKALQWNTDQTTIKTLTQDFIVAGDFTVTADNRYTFEEPPPPPAPAPVPAPLPIPPVPPIPPIPPPQTIFDVIISSILNFFNTLRSMIGL